MLKNKKLNKAKEAKNDEFYTLYEDIEKELSFYPVEQFENKTILCPCDDYEWSNFTKYFIDNFERLKLKKLICTCIAKVVKPSVFQIINGSYEENQLKGKLFIKTKDKEERKYLNSDGDFRNKEIQKYKEEADIIITNPPFSLFREFFKWIIDKKFLVIGNKICIICKEIFPYIKNNKITVNYYSKLGGGKFLIPNSTELKSIGVAWFTNLEHRKRHHPLQLMTLADNIKYSKHKEIKGVGYQKYDNYDAIEIPFTNAIPSDYKGVMGVPVTFLNKYCSEQFEIIGYTQRGCHDEFLSTKKYDDYREYTPNHTPTGSSGGKTNENANLERNDGINNYFKNKEGHIVQSAFGRIFIRNKFK